MRTLVERFCSRDDLSSYDPYDMWKTRLGFCVKKLYSQQPRLGLLPAGVLALLDNFGNHVMRRAYTKMEHPIVRAIAALCLLNLYRHNPDPSVMQAADRHLEWLLAHSCLGHSGYCWGLAFPHAGGGEVVYDVNTPLSTITPYALEAFVDALHLSEKTRYQTVIESIFRFVDLDLKTMEEDEEALATSYGPFRDRMVINAVSYTMYAHCLLLPFVQPSSLRRVQAKVQKLYAYVRRHQRSDGSWFYSPHGRSFIDCFHSCVVLKNVIKSDRIMKLENSNSLVSAGYEYLVRAFLDDERFLFRRFSISNKPGLVRYDLYDNAEALNLALLLGDAPRARRLLFSILKTFCSGWDIYSQIDVLGHPRKKNTLRWAVMPFLYAVSQIPLGKKHCVERSTDQFSKN